MRYVYATQFNVRDGSFPQVREQIEQWFNGSYQNRTGQEPPLQYDGEARSPIPGHTIEASHHELGEDRQLLHLYWKHPDDDGQLTWTTEVMLAEAGDEVEFGTTVGVGSQTFKVRPIGHLNVRAPGIVRDVLENYESGLAQFEIPTDRVVVNKGDVKLLVEDVLENEQRALPVVLVSRDPRRGGPLVNVEEMNGRLTGLAHVYEISREASFKLTALVGKVRSCFNGAVRLYWPGFHREGPYRRHTLYLADDIREEADKGRLLRHQLFRTLSNVASARFREGEIWSELNRKVKRERQEELLDLREQVKNQEADPEEVLDEFAEEMEQLRKEKDQLSERVKQLEAENANHEENLEVLRQQLGGKPEEVIEEVEEETEPGDFDNVLDAVEQAEEDFVAWIHIWSDAFESAGDSPFSRPNEVYEALGAIAELAELDYQESSTGPWKNFFEQRGIKYAPDEKQVTMGKYGDERILQDQDTNRRKEIQRHLRLGAGSREECVQIYFDREEGTDKFAVGYCGMHLPTESWSS